MTSTTTKQTQHKKPQTQERSNRQQRANENQKREEVSEPEDVYQEKEFSAVSALSAASALKYRDPTHQKRETDRQKRAQDPTHQKRETDRQKRAQKSPQRVTARRARPQPGRARRAPAAMARAAQRGMTLVELMVVVTVLALMATAVSISVVKVLETSKVSKAKGDIATFNTALDFYYNIEGEYPGQGQGLTSLVTAGPDGKRYLKQSEIPTDPWKQQYLYRFPGTKNSDSYDVCSRGPDKQEGTPDDICN